MVNWSIAHGASTSIPYRCPSLSHNSVILPTTIIDNYSNLRSSRHEFVLEGEVDAGRQGLRSSARRLRDRRGRAYVAESPVETMDGVA